MNRRAFLMGAAAAPFAPAIAKAAAVIGDGVALHSVVHPVAHTSKIGGWPKDLNEESLQEVLYEMQERALLTGQAFVKIAMRPTVTIWPVHPFLAAAEEL